MLSRKTGTTPMPADPSMEFAGQYGGGQTASRVAAINPPPVMSFHPALRAFFRGPADVAAARAFFT